MTQHEKIVQALTRLGVRGWTVNGNKITYEEGATKPTKAEIDAEIAYLEGDEYKKVLLKAEMKAEAIRIAQERVLDAEIKKDPYLSAMADVKAKIDSGEINENARKAIKDKLNK